MINSIDARSLAKLTKIPVFRRILSLLEGNHMSVRTGRTIDFRDMADYRPGDEVRDIDWKATARQGRAIIRRYESSANLQVILLADTGHSMATMSPSGESKETISLAVCQLIAALAAIRGDQLGVVAGNSQYLKQLPARSGRVHTEMVLRCISDQTSLSAPPSDLSRLLVRAVTSIRMRSLIVIVTDAAHLNPSDEDFLRKLRARHEVFAVSIEDKRAGDFPAGIRIHDVDAGPLPEFMLNDTTLTSQADAAEQQRKMEVSQLLHRCRIRQISIHSSEGIGEAFVAALERGERVR